jgi:hypothetical protein
MGFVDKLGGMHQKPTTSFVEKVGGVPKTGAELGFTDELLLEKIFYIVLYRGYDPDGRLFFCYMAIQHHRVDAFARAVQDGTVSLREYGVPLAGEYGDVTPEDIAYMEATYGFKHEGYATLDGLKKEQPGA